MVIELHFFVLLWDRDIEQFDIIMYLCTNLII